MYNMTSWLTMIIIFKHQPVGKLVYENNYLHVSII